MSAGLDPRATLAAVQPAVITPSRQRPIPSSLAMLVILAASAAASPAVASSDYGLTDQPLEEGLALLQVEPYDVIYFSEESGGGWVKVKPLPFPGRRLPSSPAGTLSFNILGFEGRRFGANWDDIQRIDLWEAKLQREAKARIEQGDFVGAYPFLAILMRDFPTTPGLRGLRTEFLVKDAMRRFQAGQLEASLAMLEELRRFDPNFRPDTVLSSISRVTDSLLQRMVDEGQMDDAQQLLARLKQDYRGAEVASVDKWDRVFLNLAQEKRDQALAAVEQEDWRQARRAALDSLYLYPEIEGGRELVQRIATLYPLVRVGVLQQATELDPTRMDNWPARRSGRLTYRTLFEMRGAGPEGGEYDFILGEAELSPDRMELDLRISPQRLRPPLDHFTSYGLADLISDRARPSSQGFSSPWAAVLDGVSLVGPQQVTTRFRRPHVMPSSLLQIRIDGRMLGLETEEPTGVYARVFDEPGESRFRLTGQPANDTQPREVVELKMETASQAVTTLLRGEVDVLDRLFPSDANRLRRSRDVVVSSYPLPTVHLLIPCSDHPYVAERNFRRGLLYAINRHDILNGELLGNIETPGCRVISGPFPAGIERNDPLAYAYNNDVAARSYQPQLGMLLTVLAQKQQEALAERRKTEPPELTPIRLATPDDDLSRIACEAIKTQWELIGLEVELVVMPAGESMPEEGTADLVYVVAAVWEPIVDARRLLGPEGLAGSDNQFVGLGLRDVEAARNWRQARDRLHDLHRTVNHELPILPLWQIVDSYAYRRDVVGVGRDIVSLYQNVERWRLNLQ